MDVIFLFAVVQYISLFAFGLFWVLGHRDSDKKQINWGVFFAFLYNAFTATVAIGLLTYGFSNELPASIGWAAGIYLAFSLFSIFVVFGMKRFAKSKVFMILSGGNAMLALMLGGYSIVAFLATVL